MGVKLCIRVPQGCLSILGLLVGVWLLSWRLLPRLLASTCLLPDYSSRCGTTASGRLAMQAGLVARRVAGLNGDSQL